MSNTNVNTYNSDGRIVQVEYAMKAMNLGTTTIGVCLGDCIVMASEKKLVNALQKPESLKKHYKIYDKILASYSGISGDAPTIVDKCRNICLSHQALFDEQISGEKLMEDICALALKFGEDDYNKMIFSRPFGVSMLVAIYNKSPQLYCVDPSGSYLSFRARAIGSAHEIAESILTKDIETFKEKDETIIAVLRILKGVMKDPMNPSNIELSVVHCNGIDSYFPEQLEDLIKAL